MSEQLRQSCRHWLQALPGWLGTGVRGSGLRASDVVDHLVLPELERYVTDSGAREVERLDEADLETALDSIATQVSLRLEQAREAIDDGVATALEQELNITAGMLGASVTRALGAGVKRGAPLTDEQLADHVTSKLEATAPAGRTMPRDDFERAYASVFDETWTRIGAANLLKFPYSDPGLGPDERPPLVRDERENTWFGTERSIYSRYSLAAKDAQVAGDADALSSGEIERACGRWGMSGDGTFVVMRSLYSGVTQAPVAPGDLHPGIGEFSRAWQDEPGPLREADATHALGPRGRWVNGELAAYAQAQLATYLRREDGGRYLRQAGRVDEGRVDAMKRAWMMCFEDDRRSVDPTAARGKVVVATAIYKGIPAGQTHRRKAWARWTPDERRTAAPAAEVDHRGNTWDYVASIGRDRSWRLLLGDPDEVGQYHVAALDTPMLPIEELMKLGSTPPTAERGAAQGVRDAH